MPKIFAGIDCFQPLCNEIAGALSCTASPRVLEVGGVDRPLLSKNPSFEYWGLDIDSVSKPEAVYDYFLVQSVEDPIEVSADLVISNTLLEHVKSNSRAIESIFNALKRGGETIHYIPSKWHPYSVLLRLVGPRLQKYLILRIRPEAADVSGYPAFFDQCSPRLMTLLFEENGFQDISVRCFYRANGYFDSFLPAYIMVSLFENVCMRYDLKMFASGFIIRASRPNAAS